MSSNAYYQPLDSEKGAGDRQALLPAHQPGATGQACCQGCALRQERKERKQRRGRRIVHFLGLLLISCWVGLHIFKGAAFLKFGGKHMQHEHNDEPVDFPIPHDINLGECADWEDAPARWTRFRSKTSFELPLSSDKLFLLSRGIAAGDLKVEATDDDSDVATVTVFAHYKYEDALDYIKVCEIDKGDNEKGIGFFGPRHIHHPHNRDLGLHVILSLPRGGADKVLNIKNFETDLPLIVQHIEDLVGKVAFENVKLRAVNVPIDVESLSAEYADVASVNAKVEGRFDVTDELVITTANAPIKVLVNAFNEDKDVATKVNLKTSNGAIKSDFNLNSNGKDSTGGKFEVTAQTAAGAADVNFLSAPVGSSLNLDVHTSVGRAYVKLHETYEGSFEASTSIGRATVNVDQKKDDPAGKGRKRNVHFSRAGNTVKGDVSWAEEGKERGSVKVVTSIAAVTLEL